MCEKISRYNVSVNDGFVKENEIFGELSLNAKSVLKNLLALTSGDLSQTAKFLDQLLDDTQKKIRRLTDEENLTDEEFNSRLLSLKSEHKDTLDIIENLYKKSFCTGDVEESPHAFEKVDKTCNEKCSPERADNELYTQTNIQQISEPDSEANEDNQKDSSNYGDENPSWRHHITIPKPFEMTKRDEKLRKQKSFPNSLAEHLRQRNGSDDTNEAKCNPFRAKPVPAHVYLPLYEKIMEDGERRREAIKAYSQELLKATEKPFSFTIRENMHREENRPYGENFLLNKKLTGPQKQCQKLTIVDNLTDKHSLNLPSHIYQNRYEKLQEDALLKEVRRQLRAQRLLQSASLPPGMEEREQRLKLRKAEREARNIRLSRPSVAYVNSNYPTTSAKQLRAQPAPDFKKLHWKSSKALQRIYKPPPDPIRPKPFHFRTSERASLTRRSLSLDRDLSSAHSNNEFQKRDTWMDTVKRMEVSPPPAQARASLLRENYIRKSLEKSELDAQRKEKMEQERAQQQKHLSALMRQSIGNLNKPIKHVVQSITEEKKRELMKQDMARRAEYRKELEDIKNRVASKPLLITRQSQMMARKRAESQFNNRLREAGLDPNDILKDIKNLDFEFGQSAQNRQGVLSEPYNPDNHFGEMKDSPVPYPNYRSN